MNFPFETNGKLMILGVPILKHFRVLFLCNGKSLSGKLSCMWAGLVEAIMVIILGVPLFRIFTKAYMRLHVRTYLMCLIFVDTDIERFL